MNAGNVFMGDGPIMQGNWYNPKTGDSFTVRDTYFEDNNLIVTTTDGRRLDYNMIQQYVQTDKPMPKQQVDNTQNTEHILNNLPSEVAEMLAEDPGLTSQTNLIQQPTTIPTVATTTLTIQQTSQTDDEDAVMIRRMLARSATPSLATSIKWTKYPTKPMEMLVEYMSVDIDKIADFYMQQIDIEAIREKVKKEIVEYISAAQIATEEINGNTYSINEEKPINKPVQVDKATKTQKSNTAKKAAVKKVKK